MKEIKNNDLAPLLSNFLLNKSDEFFRIIEEKNYREGYSSFLKIYADIVSAIASLRATVGLQADINKLSYLRLDDKFCEIAKEILPTLEELTDIVVEQINNLEE